MEDEEMPMVENPQDKSENLQQAFADLIEAAKHVEREVPVPLTDPQEVAFSEALLEKYRKMGLHR